MWQDMINGGSPFNLWQHSIKPQLARQRDNNYHASGRQDAANRENFRKELKEMIDALYNFPCIAMWVPFNEGWGQFDATEIAEWVKQNDPSRWVDHASGWYEQGGGDVYSLHTYFRKLKLPRRIDDRPIVYPNMAATAYKLPAMSGGKIRSSAIRSLGPRRTCRKPTSPSWRISSIP